MTTLKFADTHNMVAFLAKPAESEGFEQIVDFLNAHTIKYALTINPTIYTSCIEQFCATIKAKTVNGEVQLQALVDGKKIIITKSIVRRDLQLEDAEGVDCLPNATIFEQLTLMSSKTTAWNEFSSTMASVIIYLATNQKFNFSKYIFESMVKKLDNVGKFLMYPRVGKGFSGRVTPVFPTMVVHNQEEMGEASAMQRKDTEVPQPSGPITNVVDTAVNEEMDDSLVRAATIASNLEAEQDSGNINIANLGTPNKQVPQETSQVVGLSRRVESSDEKGLSGEDDKSNKGRIADIDANKYIYLVNVHTDADMFGVNDLDGDEVIIDNVEVVKTAEETVNAVATTVSAASIIPVSAATTTTTTTTTVGDVEITLAQALAELKSAKPKANKVVIQEPEQGTTTTTPTTIIFVPKSLQDKGKGIMIEEHVVEQVKPMKRLEQIRLDEELTFKLHAEEEEEGLSREKAQQMEEANIAWDDIQAKIEADYQLAQRLQAQEREEEQTTNKSSTKEYHVYLSEKHGRIEDQKFEEQLEQESSKKQKVEEDKETSKLQSIIEIVYDEEEVSIDAIPLATKPPTIVYWKIHKEGKNSYYQIIRADGSSKMYRVFSQMLKSFDRQDLEDLYKLVKAKYRSTRPVEDLDLVLYGDLKTMFEPHVEDNIWKNQLDYRVLD
ncbi:hypothetical protein Tco_0993135 [Tanacetum coccineum]|uniref:Uncharacterized protein n=1 Tax=Tanacetum coccineum TaxID=301880 RepID=A0ABQ5F410_9ASTR